MAGRLQILLNMSGSWSVLGRLAAGTPPWSSCCRTKFTKARIPAEVFEERSREHEKFGGDPERIHKLHVVTRVKSTMRRPFWEKKVVRSLGLGKAHEPRVHKNTPSVNSQLKIIKHLVRIQPLKLLDGLPAEEDMAETYLNSKGELVVRQQLKADKPQTLDS
ncbi:large ribosomal subunit protein uL30m [Denticeps clupeoides]|uniref:Large ribosomal subunit protein uL30m n=1 Tax=Denticeps clupeoides TaxID=299321 RepID=A0AAY4B232_9TELE|nr:39S ribosomal protein L30, mitochondrial [Denticeps clupeoides]XP_028847282.1 39S ribosomal protein L30, mitochondrial [Denticeps clupeoides]